MDNRSFLIKMHMVDGSPNGVKIIEKSNWNGVGIFIPRPLFVNNKNRKELKKPGVYLLLGDLDFVPKIYIGEADSLVDRLITHVKKKDFWNILIAFTSKDESLNKAIVRYLEARLYSISKHSAQFQSKNKNSPQTPPLSEMDLTDAEGYLREMLLCLPVLGVNLQAQESKKNYEKNKLFIKSGKDKIATGIQAENEFIVLKDSQVKIKETKSIPPALKAKREDLLNREIIYKSEENYYVFNCDFPFSSPSTAAGVILGRSVNGRTEWKNENGISLKKQEGVLNWSS